jgi:hypothetical protein
VSSWALHDPSRDERLALQEGAQPAEEPCVLCQRSVRMSRAPASASFASGTSAVRRTSSVVLGVHICAQARKQRRIGVRPSMATSCSG